MKTIVIDGKEMFNRDVAHAYLARKFSFPDYYGKNLDALHDCLLDISEPTHIVLYHLSETSVISNNFPNSLLKTLQDSVKENSCLTLSFDADSRLEKI